MGNCCGSDNLGARRSSITVAPTRKSDSVCVKSPESHVEEDSRNLNLTLSNKVTTPYEQQGSLENVEAVSSLGTTVSFAGVHDWRNDDADIFEKTATSWDNPTGLLPIRGSSTFAGLSKKNLSLSKGSTNSSAPSPPVLIKEPSEYMNKGKQVRHLSFRGSRKKVETFLPSKKATVVTKVNGYKILGENELRIMRSIMLGKEEKPHASWKEVYKKGSIIAYTRPPPKISPICDIVSDSGICQVRVKATLDIPASTLYDVIHDSEYRSKWDNTMIKGRHIDRLANHSEISYYSAKMPTPFTNRDFCMLRRWAELPNNEYIIINHSVSHPQAPTSSKFVRGISMGSGYFIQSLGHSKSLLYLLSHSDIKMPLPNWLINKLVSAVVVDGISKLAKSAAAYPQWAKKSEKRWKTSIVQINEHDDPEKVVAELVALESQYRKAFVESYQRTLPTLDEMSVSGLDGGMSLNSSFFTECESINSRSVGPNIRDRLHVEFDQTTRTDYVVSLIDCSAVSESEYSCIHVNHPHGLKSGEKSRFVH